MGFSLQGFSLSELVRTATGVQYLRGQTLNISEWQRNPRKMGTNLCGLLERISLIKSKTSKVLERPKAKLYTLKKSHDRYHMIESIVGRLPRFQQAYLPFQKMQRYHL